MEHSETSDNAAERSKHFGRFLSLPKLRVMVPCDPMRSLIERQWFPTAVCILVLMVMPCLMLQDPLLHGKIFLPADTPDVNYQPWRSYPLEGLEALNGQGTDAILQFYPWKRIVTDELWHGSLPLWDPSAMAGRPLLANAQSAVFAPIDFAAFMLFGPANGFLVRALMMLFCAGLFMFLFLRELDISRASALFAGVSFMCGAFAVQQLAWPILNASLWLPLVLFCFHRALRKEDVRWAIGAGWALGASMVSGHSQWALYTIITSGFFVLVTLVWRAWDRNVSLHWLGNWARSGAILGVVALGIAAVQVLPTLELVRHGYQTSGQTGNQFADDIFRRAQFLYIFSPNILGSTRAGTYQWSQIANIDATPLALGTVSQLLALLGIVAARYRRWAGAFAVLAVAALVISMGLLGTGFIYRDVPVLNRVPPVRTIFFVMFAESVLVGFGGDVILGWARSLSARWRLAGVITAITVALCTYAAVQMHHFHSSIATAHVQSFVYRELAIGLVCLVFGAFLLVGAVLVPYRRVRLGIWWTVFAVMVVNLFLNSASFNASNPARFLYPVTPEIAFLQQKPGIFRVSAPSHSGGTTSLFPNSASVYGLQDLRVYDAAFPLANYRMLSTIDKPTTTENYDNITLLDNPGSPVMDLLNVQYLLATSPTLTAASDDLLPDYSKATKISSFESGFSDGVSNATISGETRRAFFAHAGTAIQFPAVTVMAPALSVSMGTDENLWTRSDGVQFQVIVQPSSGGDPVVILDRTLDPGRHPEQQRWMTEIIDVSAYLGQSIILSFVTRPGPANDFGFDGAFWAEPHFVNPNLAKYTPVFSGEGGNTVFRNERALPRAFLIGNIDVVPDDDAAWKAVASPQFDPKAAVILTKMPAGYAGSGRALEPGETTITQYDLNDVTVQYAAKTQTMLTLADAFDDGWSASVDGKKVPLYRAYYNLRAVAVPAGIHSVHFSYRPRSITLGAVITGITLSITVVIFAVPALLNMLRRRSARRFGGAEASDSVKADAGENDITIERLNVNEDCGQ